jgi:GMP synthase-like glutamine amidotransferase
MARALVLRHHLEDHTGLIGDALETRGFEVDLRMMNGDNPTPSLDGYDLMVILGSRSAVYDKEVEASWFGRELNLIADAEERNLPIFGICFGAQALCLYHGGVVEPSVSPEIGWYEVQAENNSDIASGPWFEFHFDRCILPDKAELWATSPRAVQAFRVGRHLGVQLRDWLAGGDDEAREFGVDVDALIERTAIETPAARERAGALIDVFLAHCVH